MLKLHRKTLKAIFYINTKISYSKEDFNSLG